MTHFYGSPKLDEAANGLSKYGIAMSDDGNIKVAASVSFDSLARINVYIAPSPGTNIMASIDAGGHRSYFDSLPDGRTVAVIEGFRPQNFGEQFTVKAYEVDKGFTLTTSLLGLLNSRFATADEVTKNAFASAYEFWEAAQDF